MEENLMSNAVETKDTARTIDQEGDFLKLNDIDHVEFWVGNARQASVYWRNFGFTPVAYTGLETGNRRYAGYVMQQRNIRFLLKTPYSPHDPMAAHIMIHGDGVKAICMSVDDARDAWEVTSSRGAQSIEEPQYSEDGNGRVQTSAIQCYGETLIRFIERDKYDGPFLPGYQALPQNVETVPVGLAAVDHIVGNVELGKMNHWVQWFHEVLDSARFCISMMKRSQPNILL